MARTEARIRTSIWDDEDYRALSIEAQWLYEAILSQKDLSACGVLTWSAGKFARLSRTLTKKRVEEARRELVKARFVIMDEDTDEVWVRSFLKWDGVLDVPNMVVSMSHAFSTVHSQPIRQGLVQELAELFPEGFYERLAERFQKGLAERLAEGFRRQFPLPPARTHAGALFPPTPLTLNPPPPPPEPATLGSVPGDLGVAPTNGVGEDFKEGSNPPTTDTDSTAGRLVRRMAETCTGHNRGLVIAEAALVVDHALRFVDWRVVDEAIGTYANAEVQPTLPRALVPAIQSRAQMAGVSVPAWSPEKRS